MNITREEAKELIRDFMFTANLTINNPDKYIETYYIDDTHRTIEFSDDGLELDSYDKAGKAKFDQISVSHDTCDMCGSKDTISCGNITTCTKCGWMDYDDSIE